MDCSEFNRLLDGYIDGELNREQRAELERHASQCSDCRDKLAASEQLRVILSHLNDDISVPLPAQAAWRKAIKEESRRRRMKNIYRACGAAAAVCVLMLGVTAMLRPAEPSVLPDNVRRIETDGVSEDVPMANETSAMSAKARSIDYIDCTIAAEDVVKAYEYLNDVITEYGGLVEREADGDERKVFVQIPGENAVDFLNAVNSIGTPADRGTVIIDESAASVGVCVTIAGA